MTVNEWMKTMRVEFGMFEFKATSPQGHIVQSKGWQDIQYRYEVIPQLQWNPHANKLADDSDQYPAKTTTKTGKHKTRAAS